MLGILYYGGVVSFIPKTASLWFLQKTTFGALLQYCFYNGPRKKRLVLIRTGAVCIFVPINGMKKAIPPMWLVDVQTPTNKTSWGWGDDIPSSCAPVSTLLGLYPTSENPPLLLMPPIPQGFPLSKRCWESMLWLINGLEVGTNALNFIMLSLTIKQNDSCCLSMIWSHAMKTYPDHTVIFQRKITRNENNGESANARILTFMRRNIL